MTVSRELQAAAETLAACVETGEFAALSVEQRFALRWLALGMAGWADRVATMEAAADPGRRPSALRRAFRHIPYLRRGLV